jgi:hypothetical protein
LARVTHPNVIHVYEVYPSIRWGVVGTTEPLEGEVAMIAIEYIDGDNLAVWLKATPRPWRMVVEVFMEVAHGLDAAHHRGLLHGDLKPANVMFDSGGHAKLVDFGLAVPQSEASAAQVRERNASAPEVNSEIVFGTPGYCAPEQSHPGQGPLDARTDIYGFCAALWDAICGEPPFSSQPSQETTAASGPKGRQRPRAWPRGAPRWLHKLLRHGLAEAKTDRPPNVAWLITHLQHGLDRWRRRLRWLVPLGTAMVAGMVAVFWMYRPLPHPLEAGAVGIEAVWSGPRAAALEASSHAAPAGFRRVWPEAAARIRDFVTTWEDARTRIRLGRLGGSRDSLAAGAACLLRASDDLSEVITVIEQAAGGEVGPSADGFEWDLRANAWLAALAPPTHCAEPSYLANAGIDVARVAAGEDDPFESHYRAGIRAVLIADRTRAVEEFSRAAENAMTLGQQARAHFRLGTLSNDESAALHHLQSGLIAAELARDRTLVVEVLQGVAERFKNSWRPESVLASLAMAYGISKGIDAGANGPVSGQDTDAILLSAAWTVRRMARAPGDLVYCPLIGGERRAAEACIDDLMMQPCPPAAQSRKCLHFRGLFAQWRGDAVEAKRLLQDALAAPGGGESVEHDALLRSTVAGLHIESDPTAAEREYSQALAVLRAAGRHQTPLGAEIGIGLAGVVFNRADYPQAVALLRDAEATLADGGSWATSLKKTSRLYYTFGASLKHGAAETRGEAALVHARGIARLQKLVAPEPESGEAQDIVSMYLMLAESMHGAPSARSLLEEQITPWFPAGEERTNDTNWQDLDVERWLLLSELEVVAGHCDAALVAVRRARDHQREMHVEFRARLMWIEVQCAGPEGRDLAPKLLTLLETEGDSVSDGLGPDTVRAWLNTAGARSPRGRRTPRNKG